MLVVAVAVAGFVVMEKAVQKVEVPGLGSVAERTGSAAPVAVLSGQMVTAAESASGTVVVAFADLGAARKGIVGSGLPSDQMGKGPAQPQTDSAAFELGTKLDRTRPEVTAVRMRAARPQARTVSRTLVAGPALQACRRPVVRLLVRTPIGQRQVSVVVVVVVAAAGLPVLLRARVARMLECQFSPGLAGRTGLVGQKQASVPVSEPQAAQTVR